MEGKKKSIGSKMREIKIYKEMLIYICSWDDYKPEERKIINRSFQLRLGIEN